MEDRIDVLLRDKLSAKKASTYVERMATNVHDHGRELEVQVGSQSILIIFQQICQFLYGFYLVIFSFNSVIAPIFEWLKIIKFEPMNALAMDMQKLLDFIKICANPKKIVSKIF